MIVFRMISDRKKLLTITCLTRNLVCAPRGSAFSNELAAITKFYIAKTLRKDGNKVELVYD